MAMLIYYNPTNSIMKELLFFIILFILFRPNNLNNTWYQCTDEYSKYYGTNKMLKEELMRNNITQEKGNNWSIYLPCLGINAELDQLSVVNPQQKIFMIYNNKLISSKRNLWLLLKQHYGLDIAQKIMPKTYVLPEDIERLKEGYRSGKHYIMKKELQRQMGLEITDNLQRLVNSVKDDYQVIQEMEKNPLLFKGHTINLRVYLLMVCQHGKITGYVYNDGIVSYSGNKYNGSMDFDRCVASFYKSQKFYDQKWPITLQELWMRLGPEKKTQIMVKINRLLRSVLYASQGRIGKHAKNMSIQLFGADFFVDNDLGVKLLEINKGPGMSPYCGRDRRMRKRLQKDILRVVGIINQSCDNFIKL